MRRNKQMFVVKAERTSIVGSLLIRLVVSPLVHLRSTLEYLSFPFLVLSPFAIAYSKDMIVWRGDSKRFRLGLLRSGSVSGLPYQSVVVWILV
jgi:hypothetical protein